MSYTTEDKLRGIINSKERIRLAIEDLGVECSTDVPFSEYPQKILSIGSGESSGIVYGSVNPGGEISGTEINIEKIGQYVVQSDY